MSMVQYDNRGSYEGSGGEIMQSESTVEFSTPNASYAIVKATIDGQIATARAFPRSLQRSVDQVKTFAGLTEGIAKSCIYALPRDGKTIEGPSARFAEILQSCWGNISVQGRVIEETNTYLTVMGECIDLERNSRRAVELRVGIVKKNGLKYSPDMVITTANAAIAKATRNAIFQVVPRAFWEDAYQHVRNVLKGKLQSIEVERTQWLDYWRGRGIPAEHVCQALGVANRLDITSDHILTQIGWNAALEAEETSLDVLFPIAPTVSVKAQNLTDSLADIKAKTAAKADAKPNGKPLVQEEFPDEPGMRG